MISIREKTLRRICALSMWKRTAAAVGSRENCFDLYAMTCGEQESIRCILSRIIHRFMRDMAGNTSVWSRKMRAV